MNELLNKTISQIVAEHHQTAPVFEKYGIDFCCKGKRPLEEACTERALNKEEIVAELNNAIATNHTVTDFNALSLSALADYIVRTHHTYVKFNMPQIYNYVLRVATKHGERFPFMNEVFQLFSEVQEEMNQHMLKEERILFPRIKQLETEGLADIPLEYYTGPISVMENEHEKAGSLLYQIRELTNQYTAPEGACTTFRLSLASLQDFEADLHQHVHLENYILFPKAVELYQQLKTASV
ncbi:MAG TPA: iron-sulfur cluster repair di-iron protein [Flavisolibacter sp.]|nr:iron-sulfur cluster repair di-iron protein [Flavisolibacter sp.]